MEEFGHVTSYDSWDEMVADQQAKEEAANARITPTQQAITYGDYVANVSSIEQVGLVFGHLQTLEECRAWHESYYARTGAWEDDGFASLQEAVEDAVERLAESHERGYLYSSNWFSASFMEGEPGDAHRSVLVPISQTIYDFAADHEGKITAEMVAEFMATFAQVCLEIEEIEARAPQAKQDGEQA